MYGITNNGTQVVITGIASFEFDTDDVSLTWEEKRKKDTTGNTQNITSTEFKYDRTLKIAPSGSTRTQAAAAADSVFTLQNLVVANYKVNTFNGTWRLKPGIKCNLKMDDDASIDISAEKWVNASQNAALTGAPIVG
jgi:hypothetical protein